MKIEKYGVVLEEFSDEAPVFDEYCKYLRDYENIKMIGRQEYLLSIERSKMSSYLKSMNQSPIDSFFGVWESEHGNFIGTLKLGHIDWRIGTGDLGIMIGHKEYRGKGLSKKICSAGLDYAFFTLGLRRVSCGCYEDNVPMCKCFEKIGFHKIGVERENVILEGEYRNHVLYDILKGEWEELKK